MNFQSDLYRRRLLTIFPLYKTENYNNHGTMIVGQIDAREEIIEPLQIMSNIITDCESIDLTKEDEICNFCNKYGLLGGERTINFMDWLREHGSENLKGRCNIREYSNKTLESITAHIESKEPFSIDTIGVAPFAQSIDDFANKMTDIKEVIEHFLTMDNKSKANGSLIKTKPSLATCINSLIKGVQIGLIKSEKGFIDIYDYSYLSQSIGIYFYEKALKGSSLRRCQYPECRHIFTPTSDKQTHCPFSQDQHSKNKRGPVSLCKIRHDAMKRKDRKVK